ncbi:MAG: cyclic nucleotide-binding domain-containing protein [Verrucomicrobia bacterium]|nr:cyclic nucleotide-binding domain-containing protein [Verrucomicrobiota bacterium]MCF7709453.1 cyclic nucleotide-binding domain-containing protein [Verrucomicrobiota bacterium]
MHNLSSIDLFKDMPDEELDTLERAAESKSIPAGKLIFTQGEPCDGLYLIKKGKVLIQVETEQKDQLTIKTLGPDEVFGEMALVDLEPRSASAIADTNLEALLFPRKSVEALLSRSPRLAIAITKQISLRMREFNHQYINQVLKTERLSLVSKLAASIVHDFKNPLGIIGVATDISNADAATPEQRALSAKRIHEQIERLTGMVNELLEFTRGSKEPSILSKIHYPSLIENLLKTIGTEIRNNSISLCLKNPTPDVDLLMHPRRIQHLLQNLISNAVDAMPGGGEITIGFELLPREVVTYIEDNGDGISNEILDHLFEPFATYGKSHGTGLGLSICKKIVEDHHGWINAKNRPDGGAVFAFGLPLPKSEDSDKHTG